MRVTVLGGCGAWPAAGQACSGYLIEHDGFWLLVDAGFATLPRLLERVTPGQVDAVFISHGHPDHCADLNPLLRARALRDDPMPPLPVYALPGALDAVLALDHPGMLAGACALHEFSAGVRLAAGSQVVAYTGDSGPCPLIAELARHADLLVAESSYIDDVPEDSQRYLSSARHAGRQAANAGAGHLVLTHLLPGTDHQAAHAAARAQYDGDINIATPGLVLDLG